MSSLILARRASLSTAATAAASPLSGKVFVITGASSGIGAELAKKLASQHKAKLVLLARRKDALDAVLKHCLQYTDAVMLPCDVTVKSQLDDALKLTVEKFGHADVWINNAGRGISKPVMQLTEADVNEMMQVNLMSALFGMQIAVEHFKTKSPPSGMVLNVSSNLGRISAMAPIRSAYCASKHALNALTSALRSEIAKSHPEIVVSLFSPGAVATEFGLNALYGGYDNRKVAGVQDVHEVVDEIIKGVIDKKEDFYSLPVFQKVVAEYYKDVAQADRILIDQGMPALMKKAMSSKM